MFVDLNSFSSEKAQYNQKVAEIKGRVNDPAALARNLEEERLRFKGITRKYLASAINVIKEIFKVDFSLYKIGRDVDANFKTIETTVQKTQTEIANELNVFIRQANSMNLDAATSGKIALAVDIIMSYVDDVAVEEDDSKAFYVNHSKVKASSLDLPVTNRENLVTSHTPEIQHNPYTNKFVENPSPVVPESTPESKIIVDPFASLYGEPIKTTPVVNQVEPTSVVSQAPVVSAADVFGVAAISSADSGLPIHPMQPQQSIPLSQSVMPQNTQPMYSQQQTASYQQPVYEQPLYQQPVYNQPVQPTPAGQQLPLVQPTQIEQVSVNNANSQTTIEEAMPKGKKKDNIIFSEKNTVLVQLISAIILPLLIFAASFIVIKILEFQIIRDFMGNLPQTLQTMFSYIIMVTIFVVCGSPVLSLAKKRTRNLERFLVAPTLLSLGVSVLYLFLINKLSFLQSFDVGMILVSAVVLYMPFITVLYICAFASLNMEYVEKVRWNIFEKLGFLLVIYQFIIPTIYMILLSLNITQFDKIYSIIYFNEFDQELVENIKLGVNIAIPLLIMIVRSIQDWKKARRS